MARTLGGGISVSICAAVLHSTLNVDLPDFLDPEQVDSLKTSLEILKTLSSKNTEMVRVVFGKAYNRQFQIMLAFALENVVVAAILLNNIKKRVRSIALRERDKRQNVSTMRREKVQKSPWRFLWRKGKQHRKCRNLREVPRPDHGDAFNKSADEFEMNLK